jgi:hypothetical protein
MTFRPYLIAAALLAATPALAKAATTILPGYWESTSTSRFIVPLKSKTERRCLTAAAVEQYMNNPSTSHYKCSYTRKVVAGGKAEFVGQCFDKHKNQFNVAISGDYAPEAFTLKASFSPSGLPVSGQAITTARRLGECPGN